MQYPHPTRVSLLLFSFFLLSLGAAARAAVITTYDRSGRALYCASKDSPKARVQAANGRGDNVHPAAVATLTCVVRGLEKAGLRITAIGGYGCRAPLGRSGGVSNHPKGLAIDVNQYARDRTNPTVPRAQGIQIARACNAVSGAVWRSPDNGHFEIRSLPRSARPVAQQPAPRAPYPGDRYYNPDGSYYPPPRGAPQRQQYQPPRFYFPLFGWLANLFRGRG